MIIEILKVQFFNIGVFLLNGYGLEYLQIDRTPEVFKIKVMKWIYNIKKTVQMLQNGVNIIVKKITSIKTL